MIRSFKPPSTMFLFLPMFGFGCMYVFQSMTLLLIRLQLESILKKHALTFAANFEDDGRCDV